MTAPEQHHADAQTPFEGFATGGAATTLPAQFFVDVLPQIDDDGELRVTLYALYSIARRRGQLRAVRAGDLRTEGPLIRSLARHGGVDAVGPALDRAAERGTLLACPLDDGDALYFVNNTGGRRNMLRVTSGALKVPGAVPRQGGGHFAGEAGERPARPAQIYEQEIGTLTPSVAEALAEAGEQYPEQWIVDALREAAKANARSWRYADAILQRWESEGRDDAPSERDSGTATSKRDPYARVIRRSWP